MADAAARGSAAGPVPPRRPNLPYQAPPGTWDRERCLGAIRLWVERFDATPRAYEWSPHHGRLMGRLPADRLVEWERSHPTWPATSTVRRHCGRWGVALAAAGVAPAPRPEPELPLGERVAAAQRLRADGMSITAIADMVGVDGRAVRNYLNAATCPDCGGPLVTDGAKRCAECHRPRLWSRYERGPYLAALGEWVAETGTQPSWRDWSPTFAEPAGKWRREYPRFPPAAAATRLFGSWAAALEAAGLRPQQRPWERQEIIDALNRWATEHGRRPSYEDWRLATEEHPSAATAARRFGGSWPAAVAAAGMPAQAPRVPRWDRHTIISALRGFAADHGRPPLYVDFAASNKRLPDPKTVARYLGSWRQALTAAGLAAPGNGGPPLRPRDDVPSR